MICEWISFDCKLMGCCQTQIFVSNQRCLSPARNVHDLLPFFHLRTNTAHPTTMHAKSASRGSFFGALFTRLTHFCLGEPTVAFSCVEREETYCTMHISHYNVEVCMLFIICNCDYALSACCNRTVSVMFAEGICAGRIASPTEHNI